MKKEDAREIIMVLWVIALFIAIVGEAYFLIFAAALSLLISIYRYIRA